MKTNCFSISLSLCNIFSVLPVWIDKIQVRKLHFDGSRKSVILVIAEAIDRSAVFTEESCFQFVLMCVNLGPVYEKLNRFGPFVSAAQRFGGTDSCRCRLRAVTFSCCFFLHWSNLKQKEFCFVIRRRCVLMKIRIRFEFLWISLPQRPACRNYLQLR